VNRRLAVSVVNPNRRTFVREVAKMMDGAKVMKSAALFGHQRVVSHVEVIVGPCLADSRRALE
jgi:hypothetical protein